LARPRAVDLGFQHRAAPTRPSEKGPKTRRKPSYLRKANTARGGTQSPCEVRFATATGDMRLYHKPTPRKPTFFLHREECVKPQSCTTLLGLGRCAFEPCRWFPSFRKPFRVALSQPLRYTLKASWPQSELGAYIEPSLFGYAARRSMLVKVGCVKCAHCF